MVDATSPDFWKLTLCPRCDYSLQGLPDSGVCPECGESYCQDFIILRGKPILLGDYPNGLRITSPIRISTGLLFIVLLAATARTANPWLMTVLVIATLTTTFRGVVWFSQPRRGEALIWMGRQGVAQQALLERGSLAARLQIAVKVCTHILFPAIVMFLLVAAFRLDRGLRSHDPFPESNVICGLVFALPTLAIAGLNYLGQRRRVTYRGQGIRPGLLRWTAYRAIEIQPLGDRQYQLKTTRFFATRMSEMIHIEFTASAAAIQELCTLISHMSEQRRVPVVKPLVSTMGAQAARNAGLAVRKIFIR
jgi:hypothetical protein